MRSWSDDAFAGYLAAMIDGEGHIELMGQCSVRVRIANTVKPTLDAMADRLGFGRVKEYARPKDKNYKRLFVLEVANLIDIGRLFAVAGPFIHMKIPALMAALAIVKRAQDDAARIDARNRAVLAAIGTKRRQIDIAADFGISPQLVSRIKRGHTWPSVIASHRGRKLEKKFVRGADQSFRLHGGG